MDKKELKELRTAIKSVCRPTHTLRIDGNSFYCVWRNDHFIWTAPSGEKCKVDAKTVLKWIGAGEYITDYCFDYVDNGEMEE